MADSDITDIVERLRSAKTSRASPALLDDAIAEINLLRGEVVAYCSVWAITYSRNCGLPYNHLHPEHYDSLARCGARMTDFVRAEVGGRHGQ
jgi:hypothetical protein